MTDSATEIICRHCRLGKGGIELVAKMYLKRGKKTIKELTEEFGVLEVIRCADSSEDFKFVKIIYSVLCGDLYISVMPFRAFLNCRFDKYCKHIKRFPQCSDNDFNRIFDYAVKFATYKDEKLSIDDIGRLEDSLGTSLIPY